MKKILKFIIPLIAISGSINASTVNSSLSLDDELICSVKGCKKGIIVLATLVNPVAGLLTAAYEPSESDRDIKKIKSALDRGANINYQDAYSWTPLMYAAYGGYPHIASYLISKGARKDIVDTKSSWRGYNAKGIAEYYLNRYQNSQINCKPDMVEFYKEKVEVYSTLKNLLS